jgi:hypothetical protein
MVKKIVFSRIAGSESGSVRQRYGSAEPDPYPYVTDPQHCTGSSLLTTYSPLFGRRASRWAGRRADRRPAKLSRLLLLLPPPPPSRRDTECRRPGGPCTAYCRRETKILFSRRNFLRKFKKKLRQIIETVKL